MRPRLLLWISLSACAPSGEGGANADGADGGQPDSGDGDDGSDGTDGGDGSDGGDGADGGDGTEPRVTLTGAVQLQQRSGDHDGRLKDETSDETAARVWVAAVAVDEAGLPADPPVYLSQTLVDLVGDEPQDFVLDVMGLVDGQPYRILSAAEVLEDSVLGRGDVFGADSRLYILGERDLDGALLIQPLPAPPPPPEACDRTLDLSGQVQLDLDLADGEQILVAALDLAGQPGAFSTRVDASGARPGDALAFRLEVCADQGLTGLWTAADGDGFGSPLDPWGPLLDVDGNPRDELNVLGEDIGDLVLRLDGSARPTLAPRPLARLSGPLVADDIDSTLLDAPIYLLALPLHPEHLAAVRVDGAGVLVGQVLAPTAEAAGSYTLDLPTAAPFHVLAFIDTDEDQELDPDEAVAWPAVAGEAPLGLSGVDRPDLELRFKSPAPTR